MFNIYNYNLYLVYSIFIINFVLLYILFYNKLTSFIDPLTYHLLWISTQLSFLIVFIIKYGLTKFKLFFLGVIFFYIFSYNLFLRKNIHIKTKNINQMFSSEKISKKIIRLFLALFIIFLFVKRPIIQYMINSNSINEMFLYRFEELQGRNPLIRILDISVSFYINFISLIILMFFKRFKITKFIIILFLISNIFLSIISGGRSALLSFVFQFGFFVFFYYNCFDKSFIKKINFIAPFVITLSIFLAILTSSFYNANYSLIDGFQIILNRIIGSADGIEYYIKYDGYNNINSGLKEYFFSIFGVYIKQFVDFQYKNIGWQLTELATGRTADFARGANYTILLQTVTLGFYSSIIYVPAFSLIAAKMRDLKTNNYKLSFLFAFLSYNSFNLITGLEYGVLTFISGIFFYLIVILPLLSIDFR